MATFHYSLCPEEKAMTRSVLIVSPRPTIWLTIVVDAPQLWLMPDFGLYSWPEALGPKASSWFEVRQDTLDHEHRLAAGQASHEEEAEGEDGSSHSESCSRSGADQLFWS
jgi:hypothetical protein